MYRTEAKEQQRFENFVTPFGGKLSPGNRWVRLSNLVPWDEFGNKYACLFSKEGHGAPAKPFRVALGSLLIKCRLDITDEETVNQIQENWYLQYFIGYEKYTDKKPFDPSMMVHFRTRITKEILDEINGRIIERTQEESGNDKKGDEEKKNKGKLIADATCVPQDIKYPTDLGLLNEAREKAEVMLDKIHEGVNEENKTLNVEGKKKHKKPRTYRKRARKDFLHVAKKRKKSRKELRRGIKKQLQYLERDLKHLENEEKEGNLRYLSERDRKNLVTIKKLCEQQREMYREKKHSVADRIVSISQSHVRPIVRGKAGAETEFGAKLTVSLIDGHARIERHSWDNYNEAGDLMEQIERYKARYGFYPESVHADKIYLNRVNRDYCKERGIRLSGPALGRPPKDREMIKALKDLMSADARDRIPIEGVFGNIKRKYGLDRCLMKLAETSECMTYAGILFWNLEKKLRRLYGKACGVFYFVKKYLAGIYLDFPVFTYSAELAAIPNHA